MTSVEKVARSAAAEQAAPAAQAAARRRHLSRPGRAVLGAGMALAGLVAVALALAP